MKFSKTKLFILNLLVITLLAGNVAKCDVVMPEEAFDYFEFAKNYKSLGEYQKAYDYIRMIEAISTLNVEMLELKKDLMTKLGIETQLPVAKNIFDPSAQKVYKPDNDDKEIDEYLKLWNEQKQTPKTFSNEAFKDINARKLASEGEYEYSKANFEQALKLFLKVKSIENNAIVNNNLGLIYKAMGNDDKAIQCFEEALSLDAEYVQPLLNLSMLYKKNKNFEKALFNLEKAVDIAPNEFGAYYLLGNYYYEQKKYDAAANYYYKSVEIKEDFLEGYYGLGAALYAMEDYENAIKTFERAKTVDENSDKVLYSLAKSYIMTKNYKKAKYCLENAMTINPLNSYMYELAKVNYYLENYDKAAELYQMAIAESDTAELYNNLGLCYYHLRQPKKAVEFFEKASKENPNKAIYKYNMAIGYKSMGKGNLYNKYKDEAVKIIPKNAQDYIDISCIYMDLNNPEKAIECLNNGIEKFPTSKKLYLAKMQFYNANNDTAGYERTKMFYEQKFEN